MRRRPDLSPLAGLYADSLAAHGAVPKGVGWHDMPSQGLRFDKLVTVIQGDPAPPATINDLGCGYGALLVNLRSRGLQVKKYYGYDVTQMMLDMAKKKVGVAEAEFILGADLTHTADYSFASGIFNVKLDETAETWAEHVKSTICDLNAHSRIGFAFNMLTTYADYQEPHLFYGDPLEYFDFCKRSFSRQVSLLHDYPLFEWTITVLKEGEAS